ncbi:MAG: DUF488 family protein [Deltaproteobacteria bacterium]|nr:DUF488 family protein [Deltaproteobacteria bacterium]
MKTSYFGAPGMFDNPLAVSIARWPPRTWGARRRYIALAPSIALLKKSRQGLPWPDYCREYQRDVLDHLDPEKIFADLHDTILLCWEKDCENCHRRLVAEWIEKKLGFKVAEYL